jgi:hypothetical protein
MFLIMVICMFGSQRRQQCCSVVFPSILVLVVSGVARPQATLAMAWGVEENPRVHCSYSTYCLALFGAVAWCWPGASVYPGYATVSSLSNGTGMHVACSLN